MKKTILNSIFCCFSLFLFGQEKELKLFGSDWGTTDIKFKEGFPDFDKDTIRFFRAQAKTEIRQLYLKKSGILSVTSIYSMAFDDGLGPKVEWLEGSTSNGEGYYMLRDSILKVLLNNGYSFTFNIEQIEIEESKRWWRSDGDYRKEIRLIRKK